MLKQLKVVVFFIEKQQLFIKKLHIKYKMHKFQDKVIILNFLTCTNFHMK